MMEYSIPEILRGNLDDTVLLIHLLHSLKIVSVGSIEKFPLLDCPSSLTIRYAEKRLENVLEFISYIGQFEFTFLDEHQRRPSLTEFIENYSLMDENDRTGEEEESDAPGMSTVHAAKGLEWPCVFIVGMEHNLFPHERAIRENSLDEERRLFYVAITRARELLYITYAGERFKFREFARQFPSVFLKDLPPEIVDSDVPENFRNEASDEVKRQAFEKIFELLDQEPEDEYDTW